MSYRYGKNGVYIPSDIGFAQKRRVEAAMSGDRAYKHDYPLDELLRVQDYSVDELKAIRDALEDPSCPHDYVDTYHDLCWVCGRSWGQVKLHEFGQQVIVE